MTASEKLTELIENDKLTDEQQDNLHGWNIEPASYIKDYLIDLIKVLKNEADSIAYEEAVMALSDLLDYDDDDYVIYDVDSVQELDFDTLNDALDIE